MRGSSDPAARPIRSRPILFSAPLVRAILAGRKTQTRRVVSPANDLNADNGAACPWGAVGEELWVRERWGYAAQFRDRHAPESGRIRYAADEASPPRGPWRASYHMPRSACRLVLDITAVRTERLRDISRADALAEGCPSDRDGHHSPIAWFQHLWDSLHVDRGIGWNENPLVWVIAFKARALAPQGLCLPE
jgi:hypothetical protein